MFRLKTALKGLILLFPILFYTARSSEAQALGPTVEVPTTRTAALIDVSPHPATPVAPEVTLAGEYKSTKEVVEPDKPVFWRWYAEAGYTSEYNFRGTDLTPNSQGDIFIDAEVSKWGFTLGLYGINQIGKAHVDAWSIGEGGGGASGKLNFNNRFLTLNPLTTQDRFTELDVFLQYSRKLGPIDLTVGNIGFFINRQAETFVHASIRGITIINFGPFSTVGDEQFDRVFVRLATSVIPHIQPQVTYYQTIYSEGQDPFRHTDPNGFFFTGHERNDHLGGYAEGRLRGNFSVGQWLDINPYGVISYSIHDRAGHRANPENFRELIGPRSLNGWNHVQTGLELPIHLLHWAGSSSGPWAPPDPRLSLVPFGAYAYHIADPTAGTSRNEVWGGAKVALTF